MASPSYGIDVVALAFAVVLAAVLAQGGYAGRGSRTRGKARVPPLNNYRHPMEHGTSRLIVLRRNSSGGAACS
jgi:hypothetical protein